MRKLTTFLFLISCVALNSPPVQSVLFPYASESRETKSLDGLWNFKLIRDKQDIFDNQDNKIFEGNDTIKMPVPSSYNDLTTDPKVRDHVGWVLYWRDFYLTEKWINKSERVFIHFGGVHYFCVMGVNSKAIGSHKGGHIPFALEITSAVHSGLNRIAVAINNTLTNYTLPQGFLKHEQPPWYPTGFTTYTHNCDYFDYAGINRPVTLYTTPRTYIQNIMVQTRFNMTTGYVFYNISMYGSKCEQCIVELLDKNLTKITHWHLCSGVLKVCNARLWWPAMSSHEAGYLYTLKVRAANDVYRLPVGIRTIQWNCKSLMINNEPLYLRGFGMHEDADIRGRGFDNVILSRDLNLMKWLGINAIRTSHYPYADELLNEADELGILVILETPGCSIDNFSNELLIEHKRILTEIMEHHKNRPSVIMWSLANEPVTKSNCSAPYFKQLVDLKNSIDTTRPVTFVTSQSPIDDKAVQYMDVICVNRYYGWYSYPGKLDVIQRAITDEINRWHKKFSKPVILTEYGADSYVGQHSLPSRMWTEEYQVFLLNEHFKAFDALRVKGFFVGEMIWNFIDFNVPQEYFRPGKCDKGLFTRDRQPKIAAHIVRTRYHSLDSQTDNGTDKNKVCDDSFSAVQVP